MRKKPSILFINRVLYPEKGETGRILRDLSRAFAQDGWDVTILSLHSNKQNRPTSKKVNIKTAKALFGKSFFGYVWAWFRLFFLALFQPRKDIIVTMTDPPLLVVVGHLVSLIKGSRHVHWCQDLYPDLFPVLGYPKILKVLTNWCSVRALRKCDKVIVIGRCMARKIAGKKVQTNKITVIPNWYNPLQKRNEKLRPKPSKKQTVSKPIKKGPKKEQDIIFDQTPKFRVLYAGSVGRGHDVQTILKAARKIQDISSDIEFVFVSNKQGHEKITKIKNDLGVHNIRLIPFQPESSLKPLMESGDVHIMSLSPNAEGLIVPSKFYSALAANRPSIFIGPKSSEIAKVIQDFDCGSVIEPGKEKELVKTIESYRNDEDIWFKHQEGASEAARRFLPEQSWQVWLQRMLDLMRQP